MFPGTKAPPPLSIVSAVALDLHEREAALAVLLTRRRHAEGAAAGAATHARRDSTAAAMQ